MSDTRDIAIALLEETQKTRTFELRDADYSLEEISKGTRPKHEKTELLKKRRKVKAALEKGQRELKELRGY